MFLDLSAYISHNPTVQRTVEIFEKEIFGRDGTLCLVDAASLLWRLELSGYKVKNEYWLKVFEYDR